MERPPSEDFSVSVLASDLGIDGRSLLSLSQRRARAAEEAVGVAYAPEEWHDCSEDDFSDLKAFEEIFVL
ncbi:hypothetical protein KSP40_PGU013907 [Platanthera guangdongensis]|uniref:Uncharacterized protein n=1 Tax=Platanthera guangdongensis TaxID=2320717 RepID=A0ABR2N0J5_9ASPA